ncbi:MAG: hypothetical protein QMC67_15380 [Candidatus Wallbacteria bacterium]
MAAITIGSVYTFCFVLGLGFSILSAIFSSFFDHHTDIHGVHIEHDSGHGGDTQMQIEANNDGFATIQPLSPLTMSVFATSFGGYGLLWQRFTAGTMPELGVVSGIVFGVIIAAITFMVFIHIFRETQSSSLVHSNDIIGIEGELTVGISNENPIGQIVYTAKNRRNVSMARSFDGNPIEKNRKVTILKVDNNQVYVKE